ncbi:hypothetical protein K402DRAFT_398205 [Aulographum hederae CBS 113979]|uniref:MINDY deubiquitinase domain-containing protein n=1 Tax=Aulographum hederae CBS 113979 TaxID=1176131 RepID=A0A6G1GM25_9PEZI|nr:hypothetical protein K402DRAFT_398205 [Aulographum hederae CBS 113979]
MVTRKPVASEAPPYPTTPTIPSAPPPPPPTDSMPERDHEDAANTSSFHLVNKADVEEPESSSDWDTGDEDDEGEGEKDPTPEELPAALRIGGGSRPSTSQDNEIPEALRVGRPRGAPQNSPELGKAEPAMQRTSSWPHSQSPQRDATPLKSHNPYLKMQTTGENMFGAESSQSVWGNPAAGNNQELAELSSEKTPIEQVSKLSLLDAPHSPSQQAPLIPVETEREPPAPERHASESSSIWEPGMDISSMDAFTSRAHGLPADARRPPESYRTWEEQQAWEKSERERKQTEAAAAQERAQQEEKERKAEEEWHRGEEQAKANAMSVDEPPPALPPRRSMEDEPPPKPPRPDAASSSMGNSLSPNRVSETPSSRTTTQKKEHYQIRHIHWYDATNGKLRPAPILIQNANGPCPLLALVNALVLSTPVGLATGLIETLRTREQVSLGLLLDAVIEELMSDRRAGNSHNLPDVSDLYAFLITLHTGMNVNPSFVSPGNRNSAIAGGDWTEIVPSARPAPEVGGFEETREMKLYSTFNVPLMHGWLPEKDSHAYIAFQRSAKTYEESQNIQFRLEELEAKLSLDGLSPAEQQLFEDIATIKEFLDRYPTQLTPHGLGQMLKSLRPGEIAILFRNDHFSTVYKEPKSRQILTLVTDFGYASHDEIVWESLVDVSGQGSELFSGDFRPVGGIAPPGGASASRPAHDERVPAGAEQSWTTVEKGKRNGKGRGGGDLQPQESGVVGAAGPASQAPASSSNTEQEDHDLALALQLQEEEEDRHRREMDARRRRENELSREYLSRETPVPVGSGHNRARSSGQEARPDIPPRRHNNPGVTRPAESGGEAPPPTYEQAARGRPYVPPTNHPSSVHAPVPESGNAAGRRQSSYSAQANQGQQPGPQQGQGQRLGRRSSAQLPYQGQGPPGRGGPGGRRPGGPGQGYQHPQAAAAEDKEKCVVM